MNLTSSFSINAYLLFPAYRDEQMVKVLMTRLNFSNAPTTAELSLLQCVDRICARILAILSLELSMFPPWTLVNEDVMWNDCWFLLVTVIGQC